MFKFNFDLDEDLDSISGDSSKQTEENVHKPARENESPIDRPSMLEIHLETLISALPPLLSYSSLPIPTSSGEDLTLVRRDLYDARFQIISRDSTGQHEQEKNDRELQFLDAPSDLVPGEYEGGLKTWECSLDLAAYLHEHFTRSFQGKRVLELGCGTAIPSLYLLHNIFNSPYPPKGKTAIHLQDYNDLVFRLVTFPNIILNWYMSPASATYRASTPVENQLDDDSNPLPPPDSTQSGDLPITSALTSAFLDSLSTYDVDIRFFCGTWASIDIQATGGIYDVVLTSETIYRMESLPPLVNLMRRACIAEPSLDESLSTKAETLLSISSRETSKMQEPTCLVAAKLVYFGVGGGVAEFVKAIEGSNETGRKGDVENVWETRDGVRRCIMRVQWL